MNLQEKIEKYLNEGKKLTATEARKKDKNKKGEIEVYIDYEQEEGGEIVGINSGFVYATPMNPKKWIKNQKNFKLEENVD